ncbi:MAG: hypothetical protein IH845_04330 [Nanoarchaeota archaeon]|nr:hypothetical protein [Nanoarchaeota archaeon]
MDWGKVVLIFQAGITLIIAMVFMSQLNLLDTAEIQELNMEFINYNIFEENTKEIIDIKARYKSAAYILSITGLIELIIISRILR